jgi:hypothetical protein
MLSNILQSDNDCWNLLAVAANEFCATFRHFFAVERFEITLLAKFSFTNRYENVVIRLFTEVYHLISGEQL